MNGFWAWLADLLATMEDPDPAFTKVVDDHFWELIGE